MKSSIMNKSILAVAVLVMAAFAGVMVVGEDTDAAGETVTYKVTYSYGDYIKTEVVAPTPEGAYSVELMTFTEAFGAAAASEMGAAGYTSTQWKSGASVYAEGDTLTLAGDITLQPVLTPDKAIIKLVYGDIAAEYVTEEVSEGEPAVVSYPLSFANLKDFATKIGAKVMEPGVSGGAPTESTEITANTYLAISGYEFCDFRNAAGDVVKVNEIVGADDAVTTFKAVFEPVYGVTFIVEGATVLETTSDKIIVNDKVASGEIPVAPTKENYIFMGWYDAEGTPVFSYSIDKNEYTVSSEEFKFTTGTILYAKFVPVTFTVTFVYGEAEAVFETETVKYGERAIEPKGLPEGYKGWDFDFATPIVADTQIVAVAADPVTVFDVTFEIEGKTPVTMKSDSMVVPDTYREGYAFQGWVVKGETQYVDPMTYDITGAVTFVAVYKEVAPPAPEEPGFFSTPTGQCVAVLVVFAIGVLGYLIYTGKIELPKFKISRVKGENKP